MKIVQNGVKIVQKPTKIHFKKIESIPIHFFKMNKINKSNQIDWNNNELNRKHQNHRHYKSEICKNNKRKSNENLQQLPISGE